MAVDQFGFLQPIDRLGQGVVVAVAPTADRGLYAGLRETGARQGSCRRIYAASG
jgi:hypothetical protein